MTPLTLIALIAVALVYWFPVRRWFARWGTTPDDLRRVMPGDALIAKPMHSATHAVTVEAEPGDIWPWLLQMGSDRGGLYSYDWLDRMFGILARPSATRIIPEFQHLAVGDVVRLGPRERLTVRVVDPLHALALSDGAHGFEWVWQFGIYSLDASCTRLVSRGTERYAHTIAAWLFMRVMEPAAFIMTRRMLLGIKQRAEALRTIRRLESPPRRPAAAA
jgi:hypothetical protein